MRSAIRFGVLFVVLGAPTLPRAGLGDEPPPAKPLIVCATPDALPRTGKAPDGTPRGLDIGLARLLGKSLGRAIEYHWCGGADCAWRCLRAGRCDVVLGQPQDSGPPRDVAWSVPYAGGQFGLVVARGETGVRSLADLRGKRVGVVTGTVALSEKDHAVARFATREELLDNFQARALDAAFLDADFAAWYLHEHPRLTLRVVDEYVPREHWNMALAVRAESTTLLVEINRALAQLAESGELRKVYTDDGLPFRPPFDGRDRPQAPVNSWRRIQERGNWSSAWTPTTCPIPAARADRPGFDVELARALAQQLRLKLRIDWLDSQRETAIGELLQRRCDLVFGAAVDPNAVADDEELAGKVLYSRPYYATGYVLVRRKKEPRVRSVEDFQGERAQRLGAEAGSVADYRLRRRGYLRRLYRNQAATLKALDGGDIDAAYLWANAGWSLHESPVLNLELVPGYMPEDRWNVAIALGRGEDELKRHVDEAIDALIRGGTVAQALARYHVPDFAPFAADDVVRHGVADRGLEPRMERIQRSKEPYSGLKRVQSAGALVVGLDQSNLPFSTAHPEPSGLDLEIARLLAEQLGVTLRVYWAYSSHDSYPSKLATKQLCDVILGVTPDDRFAQRVLYSRPYYIASYRRVVRSGEGPPSAEGPWAVEEGVAVRGLKGREVRPYPSTEAILEAVSKGQVPSGYVIATRGPWLAHRDWPGKLRFLPAPGPEDRFPVCAAVRKTDGDLKDAINRAWAELDRTGRLAQVFERWHVPYEAGATIVSWRCP